MEKTSTLNLRINPMLKQNAEEVLTRLGIPMSTAIDIFLNQVVLVGGLPFPVTIPKSLSEIDISKMSDDELHQKIQKGYDDYMNNKTQKAKKALAKIRKNISK